MRYFLILWDSFSLFLVVFIRFFRLTLSFLSTVDSPRQESDTEGALKSE